MSTLRVPQESELSLLDTAHQDTLIGKRLGERYWLSRRLGEGGMGAVYEGQGPDGELVAVKVLKPELLGTSRDALRRFVREARVSMSVRGENVVRVLEVDEDGPLGVPFITMERLQGSDLAQLVRAAGALEPDAVCQVFAQACEGLALVHDAGIVHRDIKPANIFLHTGASDGRLVVKVCDFGIAKQTATGDLDITNTELTRTGGLLGSPMYMSPEQARNAKRVDERSDIWSLCISLYEALSGQRPWDGITSPGELVLAICMQDIKPLQELAPWVSPELAAVVHKGLRREMSERFSSMRELRGVLLSLVPPNAPALSLSALRSLSPERRAYVAPRLERAASPIVTAATMMTADVLPVARSLDPAIDIITTQESALHDAALTPPPAPLVVEVVKMTPLVASEPAPPPGPSVRSIGAALVATLALLGGGALLAASSSRGQEAQVSPMVERTASPAVSAEVAPAPQPVTPRLRAAVTVPEGASVTVDGEAMAVAGRALWLEGEAGERFLVRVEREGASSEQQVTLGRDGAASPSEIALPRAQGVKPKRLGTDAKPAASSPTTADVEQQKIWR